MVFPIGMRLIFIYCLLAGAAIAETLRFASGENRTHLVELYSSEGCSSCPPAEAWLGGLRNAPGLWRDFVPVSFHVNYWDKLGWTDRWANKAYTVRQHDYAYEWSNDDGTIYTPQFVVDGTVWRAKPGENPLPISSEKAALLSVEYAEDGLCRVKFDLAGNYEAYAAVLGTGILSDIRAGENRGRKLRHDFIVLSLQTARLKDGSAELKLSRSTEPGIERQAVAFWITRRGKLTPLQATGGWLK